MEKKTYTFLITSNRKGETKSVTVSAGWLKAVFVLLAVVAILLSAASVDYIGLLLQAGENKRLKAENTSLNAQFSIVQSKMDALQNSLERVKSFSTKLKLITHVNDKDRVLKLSIAALPRENQAGKDASVDISQRQPASELVGRDDVFLKKPLPDAEHGELLRQETRDYATLSIRVDQMLKESQLREQGLLETYQSLSHQLSLLNATPTIEPVRGGWYTALFGYRIDPYTDKPSMHEGIDIAAPAGAPIYAPAGGVVTFKGFKPGYGKLLVIDHGYGVKTRYGHASQFFVYVGQRVKRYDVIAAIGSTGRTQGPHLFYEVTVNGVPVDPLKFILQ